MARPVVAPVVDGISVRRIFKFEILDVALIPREYLAVDLVKVGAYGRAMKEHAEAVRIPRSSGSNDIWRKGEKQIKRLVGMVCIVCMMSLFGCKGSPSGPTTPTTPTTPPVVEEVFKVGIEFGVVGAAGSYPAGDTFVWDVYSDSTKLGTISGTYTGSSVTATNMMTVNYIRTSAFTSEQMNIRFTYVSSTWPVAQNTKLLYVYYITTTSMAANTVVTPFGKQESHQATGWGLGDSRFMSFVVSKK